MKPEINNDAPVHELIANRWSPRAFDNTSLTHEQIKSLLEAVRWAPSCFNEQPWKVIYAIRSEDENFQKVFKCLNGWNQNWAKTAGALMITIAKENFDFDGRENIHAWHDVGLAVSNMNVQAMSMGIYTHMMGGIERDIIQETFSLPKGYTAIAGVALGFPGDVTQIPEDIAADEYKAQERKPVSDFAGNAVFK